MTDLAFWAITFIALGFFVLDLLVRRKNRRRPIVMMARPMTRYERERR